jgi:hypothetical protein
MMEADLPGTARCPYCGVLIFFSASRKLTVSRRGTLDRHQKRCATATEEARAFYRNHRSWPR